MAVLDPNLKAQIDADPRVLQLAQSRGQIGGGVTTDELRAFGYDVPDHTKFALTLAGKGFRSQGPAGGGFTYNDEAGKASKLITAGALGVMAAPALMALAGGGAAAGGAGGAGGSSAAPAAAGLIPSTSTGAAMSTAATPLAVSGGSSMAGAGGTGFLGSMQNLLTDPKFLVNAGANVLGGVLTSRAAGKAADQQAQAARDSLNLQRNIYEQGRSDQMPWLNAGRGAVTTLSRLMGVDGVNPAAAMPQTSPQGQQAMPRSPMAQLATGGGTVLMRAPDGSTRPVPMAQVAQLEARGAQRVQ